MIRAPCLALLLLAAGPVLAFRVDGVETLVLGCFAPPALALHPGDPDVAFVACSSFPVGVFPVRIPTGEPLRLDPARPFFLLPADLNGDEPDPPEIPVIDDVVVEREDLAWITTSGDELVVPWDPGRGSARTVRFLGADRLSVPTSIRVDGDFLRTDGVRITSFRTGFTSGVARIGSRLLVTTSNFARVGSNPVLYPGTVLLFDLEESPGGLVVLPADPPWLITTDPNPTAVTPLPGGRAAVTNSGLLLLGSPARPGGPGSIDVVDPQAGRIVANVPLGRSTPGFRGLALDGSGLGVTGSAVFHELYVLDLRGLDLVPLSAADPTRQRESCTPPAPPYPWHTDGVPCLRDRVVAGPGADGLPPPIAVGGGGPGFVPQVALDGTTGLVLATLFETGELASLRIDLAGTDRPEPILAGRIGPAVTAGITPPLGTVGAETGPGPLLQAGPASSGGDPAGVAWITNGPDGTVMRGSLSGLPPEHEGDSDGDGIPDRLDPCPSTPTGAEPDADGDGAGDGCDLCPAIPNPRGLRLPHETRIGWQRDDDADGAGNACDADFDQSGRVDGRDLDALDRALGRAVSSRTCAAPGGAPPGPCAPYDLSERGLLVSASDVVRLADRLGLEAGPSPPPGPCAGPACPP